MKKIKSAALLTWINLLIALCGHTQNTSPYLFFKPVYAFNTASQQLDVNTTLINGQHFSKGVYGSFAHGFSLAAGIGKMINNTLGIELGAEYLFGKKIITNYSDALSDQYSDRVNALSIRPVLYYEAAVTCWLCTPNWVWRSSYTADATKTTAIMIHSAEEAIF